MGWDLKTWTTSKAIQGSSFVSYKKKNAINTSTKKKKLTRYNILNASGTILKKTSASLIDYFCLNKNYFFFYKFRIRTKCVAFTGHSSLELRFDFILITFHNIIFDIISYINGFQISFTHQNLINVSNYLYSIFFWVIQIWVDLNNYHLDCTFLWLNKKYCTWKSIILYIHLSLWSCTIFTLVVSDKLFSVVITSILIDVYDKLFYLIM